MPQFGVWVVNYEYNGKRQIYALRAVCTHLGCTPNWLEGEQKFKCPCHGSGFYKDGINFEGPAPRPLERYAIRLADDGQLEVDKSKIFQEEIGQWSDPASSCGVSWRLQPMRRAGAAAAANGFAARQLRSSAESRRALPGSPLVVATASLSRSFQVT